MGYAVVHMQKFKSGDVRGIQSHNKRGHPPRTNPDIDTERTVLNYDLLTSKNYSRSIDTAIKNLTAQTKTIRKDAVVYCSFVVTSDEQTMKAMSPEKQRAFFEDSLKWFANRYGIEKVVNATVHMDEKTPHMHIGLVPITPDGRLSAKSLFDRKELRSIQTDFAKQVGESYGLERGNEGSEQRHIPAQRFKLETAKKELQEVTKKIAVEERKGAERVKTLQEQEKALQGKLESLQGRLLTAKELESIKPQKTLTGALKGVSVEAIENLKKTAIMGLEAIDSVKKLSLECERLSRQVPTMEQKLETAQKLKQLEEFKKAISKLTESEREKLFRTDRQKNDLSR